MVCQNIYVAFICRTLDLVRNECLDGNIFNEILSMSTILKHNIFNRSPPLGNSIPELRMCKFLAISKFLLSFTSRVS